MDYADSVLETWFQDNVQQAFPLFLSGGLILYFICLFIYVRLEQWEDLTEYERSQLKWWQFMVRG